MSDHVPNNRWNIRGYYEHPPILTDDSEEYDFGEDLLASQEQHDEWTEEDDKPCPRNMPVPISDTDSDSDTDDETDTSDSESDCNDQALHIRMYSDLMQNFCNEVISLSDKNVEQLSDENSNGAAAMEEVFENEDGDHDEDDEEETAEEEEEEEVPYLIPDIDATLVLRRNGDMQPQIVPVKELRLALEAALQKTVDTYFPGNMLKKASIKALAKALRTLAKQMGASDSDMEEKLPSVPRSILKKDTVNDLPSNSSRSTPKKVTFNDPLSTIKIIPRRVVLRGPLLEETQTTTL